MNRRTFLCGTALTALLPTLAKLAPLTPAPMTATEVNLRLAASAVDYQAMVDRMMEPYIDEYVRRLENFILYGTTHPEMYQFEGLVHVAD